MVTRVLIICVGIILHINSSYSTYCKSHCEHQTTLPINYDKAKLSDNVIAYNSGKIFEVSRNQCLNIVLRNISPRLISCFTREDHCFDYSSSSATMKFRSISDEIDGVLKCNIYLQDNIYHLQLEFKVTDAMPIDVKVNNMQLHFKTTNVTTVNYDGIAVYEFEEGTYIDLVCSNLNNISTPLFMYIYSTLGHQNSLETKPFGAAVRVTGWLTEKDENNVYIDCISQSNTDKHRNFTYRVTFKQNQNKNDIIKSHIIAYVNDEQLTHKRRDREDTKLQYKYEFGYKEIIHVSCVRKYKTDGQLAFSYKRQVKVVSNAPSPTNNDDMKILHHSSEKVILEVKGNTLTSEQTITCRIKDTSWLEAEIMLIPKTGTRQRVCNLRADSGPCKTYTIKWYFNVDFGACSQFYYGGCEGNDNQFATQKDCRDVCETPSSQDACWLPKITGSCNSNDLRWYFNTAMKQCMQFQYGGCLGNANNFISKDLCESQCNSNISGETVSIDDENPSNEEYPYDEDFEKTTTLPTDDKYNTTTSNEAENKMRGEGYEDTATEKVKNMETDSGSTMVIVCVLFLVIFIIGAACVAFWYRRKKNIDTSRNESTNQVYEDVYNTAPGPQDTSANDCSTPRYDYAYNIHVDRLFASSGPPDPCRRVKPKQDNQQDQRRSSDDSSSSESNYYCEIDDYFINKREEKKQQKQQKKNLLKK